VTEPAGDNKVKSEMPVGKFKPCKMIRKALENCDIAFKRQGRCRLLHRVIGGIDGIRFVRAWHSNEKESKNTKYRNVRKH
jgi:hypothetical protein